MKTRAIDRYPAHLRSLVQTVFHVRNGQQAGTAFKVAFDGKWYLVTAGHFANGLGRELRVSCQRDCQISSTDGEQWPPDEVVHVQQIALWPNFETDGPDVAFIQICPFSIGGAPLKGTPAALEFTPTASFVGQEVVVFGFPHFQVLPVGERGWRFPLPFMRRSSIAGFCGERIFLDGLNVPGDSGGPVVAFDQADQNSRIIGVIGGSLTQHPSRIQASRCSADFFHQLLQYNLGVGWATDLNWAVESLRATPSRWQSFDCPSDGSNAI